jgi:hypothetical protein
MDRNKVLNFLSPVYLRHVVVPVDKGPHSALVDKFMTHGTHASRMPLPCSAMLLRHIPFSAA